MTDSLRYEKRGVSASKEEVHQAIRHLDKGLYPNAFCKILPDYIAGDDSYCNIMHSDTAGTKTSLAYLWYKETGDASVWRGIAQDALVMNIDDMACVGALDNIVVSSTIGRNKTLIPGEVIQEIIGFFEDFRNTLDQYHVRMHLAGGETADVGDIVRTIDVGYTTFARMKRENVIVNHIKPGDVIVGFASYGQATYESSYNSGLGSNGLTSARHDVLHKSYGVKYPESIDPNIEEVYQYVGSKTLEDVVVLDGKNYIVGELLLSPTRTYMPLIKSIVDELGIHINGMIHCTGGGQSKVLHFVDHVKVVKNDLLPLPPVFQLIENESGLDRKEMYQVFNMGHRLEIYTDESSAQRMLEISDSFNIEARIIGHVERADTPEVEIRDDKGVYQIFG
ncbi:MAG TPA: AIR synthase-related protein [Membranihabitans sp.]|nr:AIR synthase-related protein [Membranihabitans sp.]